MATKEYFSNANIAFRKELRQHEDIVNWLYLQRAEDFEEIVGHVAALFNIEVDDYFDTNRLDYLLGTLTALLYKKRTAITLTSPVGVQ